MNDFLKGNFDTKNKVKKEATENKDTLEDQFEKEALKHLGGSIAFVSKKKVMWNKNQNLNSDIKKNEIESKDLKVKNKDD